MASSSSKWRALQRRHKWSYDAVRVSPSRVQSLAHLQEQLKDKFPMLSKFLATVLDLVQLTSTHAQVSSLKKVISAFHELLHSTLIRPVSCAIGDNERVKDDTLNQAENGKALPSSSSPSADFDDNNTLGIAFSLFVELLFLENSVPLHRNILSCLASLPLQWEDLINEAFAKCLQEYGVGGIRTRRFALAAVASSLVNLPKPGCLKGILELFASTITEALAHGVQALLQEAREGLRPTPSAMEDCQGAMSSLYYMLQYYPHKLLIPLSRQPDTKVISCTTSGKFKDSLSTSCSGHVHDPGGDDESVVIYNTGLNVILDVLQTGFLSRDCCIAAGVGLCAAMQIETTHLQQAMMLASSLFGASEKGLAMPLKEGIECNLIAGTHIEAAIYQMRGTTLAEEVGRFTEFGRLCVLRGLLTAIPRPALNINFLWLCQPHVYAGDVQHKGKHAAWNVLFDGTLPALCELCESSADSHYKFHAVTALQICLQQIKASINLGLTLSGFEELNQVACQHGYVIAPYHPLSNNTVQRILQIVWNNWEDPLNQTVKQIQVVFDLLVDVECLLLDGMATDVFDDVSICQTKEDKTKAFLTNILTELLSAGGHRKGRYVPLASLALRLGALNLLKMCPNMLCESVNAMVDDDVCCSVAAFLKAFLERLRDDCWSSEGGVMEGIITFRRLSLPPIIAGMVSGNFRLRVNINIYALPVALQIDSDAILPLLAYALDDTAPDLEESVSWHELKCASGLPDCLTTNQRVALLIGLLKTARVEALIEGDLRCAPGLSSHEQEFSYNSTEMALVSVKRNTFVIPLSLLEIAVTHSEDSLRVDAAEVLCLNPKTASMPSYLELALLKFAIPLNMRCSSTSFRMKWTSLFRKFFFRIGTAMERQLKAEAWRVKAGKVDKLESPPEHDEPSSSTPVTLQQMQSFMSWLSNVLLFSLYPSAPYERKNMSMELIAVMFENWSPTTASLQFGGSGSFLSPEATTVLLGAIVDSWDKLREVAFRILSSYPTPLPGYASTEKVETVVRWAMTLVNSPRVRESDAGALTLRLIVQKYVVQLRWMVELHPEPKAFCLNFNKTHEREVQNECNAVAMFMGSLNDLLESGVLEGEKNLLKACRHSFVHGVLLSYRYTIEELDWKSNLLMGAASALRVALARLLSLLTRVTAIALWVVSADAFDTSKGLNGSMKPSNVDLQGLLEDDDEALVMNDWDNESNEEGRDEEHAGFLAPSEQAIMVGCWLAMKEVSLLLGTITRKVPLPGCDGAHMEECGDLQSLLDLEQLELIGGHFLQVLLSMKHNGAIDKTRAGFVALCNRLLCSSDARLNKMPELWLRQLMRRTAAKGQIVDDLLRRSAGIPAAFLALFLAEPEGAPKKLLMIAMRWLIDLVKAFLEGSHVDVHMGDTFGSSKSTNNDAKECAASPLLLKERDEGVVPTVHALNVMKVTFNDTNLSTDCSGFCADGLSIAIQAFSCQHWEVRNAAMLAFTALLRRMVGFLNNQTHESARWAITGFEFFHRYPSLHSFLLKELQNATFQLEDGSGAQIHSGHLSRTLHPSLAPVLIILSRLKPSIINSDAEDWLSPSAFIALISRCATQSNLKVRVLASRALAPLVVADKLPYVLQELAECLPMQRYVVSQGIAEELGECGLDGVHSLSSRRLLTFNMVHGVLLQMHSLLAYNCMTLPLKSALRKEIVTSLSMTLNMVDKSYVFRCPMVGMTFLDVLQSLTSIDKTCQPGSSSNTVRDFLVQTCASVLDGPYDGLSAKVHWDSTMITLKAKACKLYFAEILLCLPDNESSTPEWKLCMTPEIHEPQQCMTNEDEFLSRLKDCLFHTLYDVRLGVLKAIKAFLELVELKVANQASLPVGTERVRWMETCLQPLLLGRLMTETHPHCMRYLLLNYNAFSRLQLKICKGSDQFKDEDLAFISSSNSAYDVWRVFVQVYETTRHLKTKEVAVCCLGLCIQRIFHNPSTSSKVARELMLFWLQLIQRHGAASEPVTLRRATADAIVASGFLKRVERVTTCDNGGSMEPSGKDQSKESHCIGEDWVVQSALDVWLVCLKLLEDEDVVLRDKLAAAVLSIVSPVSDRHHVHGLNDFVPAQVERVLHLSFNYLSSNFSHSMFFYLECLATWLWNRLAAMASIPDDCNLVHKLFDKELDNHHEEGLLFTQLCCLHLRRAIDSLDKESSGNGPWGKLQRGLEAWRLRYLRRLRATVENLVVLESKLQWLGGLTNHPDVFRTLYPLLLGLWVVLRPATVGSRACDGLHSHEEAYDGLQSNGDGEFIRGMVEVVQMMEPFVANPLVSGILMKAVREAEALYKVKLGLSLREEATAAENFDPFFLL